MSVRCCVYGKNIISPTIKCIKKKKNVPTIVVNNSQSKQIKYLGGAISVNATARSE